MAKPSTDITPKELEALAWDYVDNCLKANRQVAMNSGKVVEVVERHIPTVEYYLRIWIPMMGKPTIVKSTYYVWLRSEDKAKSDAIKNIQKLFASVGEDIVANEGKGIFWAKNRLGMTDKQQNDNIHSGEISVRNVIIK